MRRKKLQGRTSRKATTYSKKRARPDHTRATSLQSTLLSIITSNPKPMTLAELHRAMHSVRPQALQEALRALIESGKIVSKGKRYTHIPGKTLQATLDLTAKGYGFAMVDNENKNTKDVFIAPHNLNGASHGDTIDITITGMRGGRREGRVVQVVKRAVTKLCGIFTRSDSGKGGYLTPDNNRLPYTVFIPQDNTLNAADGTMAVAEIADYGNEFQGPTGKITEIIGTPLSPATQIRTALVEAQLEDSFPAEVLEETAALTPVTSCSGNRQDLRELPHVTIDGETARDFDDAICVQKQNDTFILYVSIADVSHYVTPDSPLDREAYRRGTSVYLPDRVLPMLPERLSNNLCSLVPDQDRPAFTAILTYDRTGKRLGQKFCKSLIRSHCRFTYTLVQQLLYEEDALLRDSYAHLVPMLEEAKILVTLLKQQRILRGSLEFNVPEPVIHLSSSDAVQDITLAQRNKAHMLIEDCMLAANEAVAETLAQAHRPVLYRIHESPDPGKLETFTDAATALGLQLPASEVSPAWFAQIIKQAQQATNEYLVNNLLLRTMQQARYSPENEGHFGLAAEYYLHFTSPIRRYPDLIAHRVLQNMLAGAKLTQDILPSTSQDLADAGLALSQCERRAIDIERDVHVRLAALFLQNSVGKCFAAIISGVTAFGLYVLLENTFISGGVPMKEMKDDYYLLDSRRYRLIGERSNKMYQLGDKITVRLEYVDIYTKRLTFSIYTPEKSETPPPADQGATP